MRESFEFQNFRNKISIDTRTILEGDGQAGAGLLGQDAEDRVCRENAESFRLFLEQRVADDQAAASKILGCTELFVACIRKTCFPALHSLLETFKLKDDRAGAAGAVGAAAGKAAPADDDALNTSKPQQAYINCVWGRRKERCLAKNERSLARKERCLARKERFLANADAHARESALQEHLAFLREELREMRNADLEFREQLASSREQIASSREEYASLLQEKRKADLERITDLEKSNIRLNDDKSRLETELAKANKALTEALATSDLHATAAAAAAAAAEEEEEAKTAAKEAKKTTGGSK